VHVLTRDHTVLDLPATYTFIHKWNEPYLPELQPDLRLWDIKLDLSHVHYL